MSPRNDKESTVNPYHLSKGSHKTPEAGRCAMEWVAFLVGEQHSDHPVCVSPVLQSFCVAFNDRLGDEQRQRLRPYLARCIGTAGDGLDGQRIQICREWLVKTAMPDWLEFAGKDDLAKCLRDLPDVLDRKNTRRLILQVREEARRVRAEARKRLMETVKAQGRERLGAYAAYAAADADAYAAYAAAAADAGYAAAYAAADADAYAAYAAAYAAAAYAAAAYAAAAYAYDDAYDDDAATAFRQRIYDAVKAHVIRKLKPIADRHAEAGFDLLEQMLPKVTIELPGPVAERVAEMETVAA